MLVDRPETGCGIALLVNFITTIGQFISIFCGPCSVIVTIMSETPSFYAAIQVAKGGTVSGIVTAPFHKEALAAGQLSPGHTEILAEQAGGVNVAMMLANEDIVLHLERLESVLQNTSDVMIETLSIQSHPKLRAIWYDEESKMAND